MSLASAPRKRLKLQTPVPEAGAVVVTCRYAGERRYETRVEGGRLLDGWTLASGSPAEARRTHAGAVRLVREAAQH